MHDVYASLRSCNALSNMHLLSLIADQTTGCLHCKLVHPADGMSCIFFETDVCRREVVASEHADRLLDAKLNAKHGNYVHEGVQLGSKTTVASACMVGRGSSLGDKCSVKRSVLGANCRLGANVKIINSVLMDGIVVDDGCHVQNSIVCSGAHLQVCPKHNEFWKYYPSTSEVRAKQLQNLIVPRSLAVK